MIKELYHTHKETAHNFIWRSLQMVARHGITFLIFIIALSPTLRLANPHTSGGKLKPVGLTFSYIVSILCEIELNMCLNLFYSPCFFCFRGLKESYAQLSIKFI